ncbi:ATP-binding protein [Promethearchaeum syntrophicum]|uniref:ATP-binding protein n=1 Tax=Promethearchaeum syntrophicum TaxID=2594042 RepID=A0A5B9D8P0_9ARCH|nr:ATP-binding protein [Candidatus Prometheoarchaeum syntrophicum]QEE15509.1 sensory histidine kinase AtoS [Candidatus Prometheoarchaeum syntrophicum]
MDNSKQNIEIDFFHNSIKKRQQILSKLLETSEPDLILEKTLEACAHYLHAEAATIVLWGPEIGFYNTTYNISEEMSIKGSLLKPDEQGLDNRLYRERNKKYIALSNYSKNMDASKILKPLGFNYAFGIPLYIKEDQMVGSLCFYFLKRTEKISEKEIALLEEIKPIVSIAILQARLYKDITHLETKDNKTNNFLNLLLNSSPDIIIDADLTGKVIFWNKAAENSTKFKFSEIKNKKLPLVPGRNEENFYELLTEVRNKEIILENNFLFQTKSERKTNEIPNSRTINLSLVPVINDNGKIDSILITGKDISEEEHLQKKIYEYHLALRNKDEEILSSKEKIKNFQEDLKVAQKFAIIGQISTLLSHQINNPLMSIISALSVLVDDCEDIFNIKQNKEEKEFTDAKSAIKTQINDIVLEGRRIKTVLKDLRLFSEITREKHFRKNTDLVEVVAQTINDIKTQKKYKEVKIKFTKNINRAKIYGNFSQLKYILNNIIENAYLSIKLKEGIKGLIQITLENILYQQKNYIVISISDNGIGIEADELDKIFDPFYSNWDPYTIYNNELKKYHIGLSLSIVHTIMLNHYGRILCKSPAINSKNDEKKTSGTTFILEFPENVEFLKEER